MNYLGRAQKSESSTSPQIPKTLDDEAVAALDCPSNAERWEKTGSAILGAAVHHAQAIMGPMLWKVSTRVLNRCQN